MFWHHPRCLDLTEKCWLILQQTLLEQLHKTAEEQLVHLFIVPPNKTYLFLKNYVKSNLKIQIANGTKIEVDFLVEELEVSSFSPAALQAVAASCSITCWNIYK